MAGKYKYKSKPKMVMKSKQSTKTTTRAYKKKKKLKLKRKTPYESRMEDRKSMRDRDIDKIGSIKINLKTRPKKSLGYPFRSKREKENREYYREAKRKKVK